MVGEAGREMFVPDQNGSIVSKNGGGNDIMVAAILQNLDDLPRALARALSAELAKT